VPDERAQGEINVLRELVNALCERVELLEAHALLVRPLLLARART
jgi:hypothetical protein